MAVDAVDRDLAGHFDEDVLTFSFSGSGVATGAVRAIDPVIPPTPEPSSTSGCEAADFVGFPAGGIALIQRGTCLFADKVANATAAGAVAVIIYNEGQPGRTEAFVGDLANPVRSRWSGSASPPARSSRSWPRAARSPRGSPPTRSRTSGRPGT